MTSEQRFARPNQFTLAAALSALTVVACTMAVFQWLGPQASPYVLAAYGALLGFWLGRRHGRLAASSRWQRHGQSLAFGSIGFMLGKGGEALTQSTGSALFVTAVYIAFTLGGVLGLVAGVIIRGRAAARRGVPRCASSHAPDKRDGQFPTN